MNATHIQWNLVNISKTDFIIAKQEIINQLNKQIKTSGQLINQFFDYTDRSPEKRKLTGERTGLIQLLQTFQKKSYAPNIVFEVSSIGDSDLKELYHFIRSIEHKFSK